MGIAFGLGIIVGVRAASTGTVEPGSLATILLLILAAATKECVRVALLLAAAGVLAGLVAGSARATDDPPIMAGDRVVTFPAEVVSDPEISPMGAHARVRWVDIDGIPHQAIAVLPPAPEARRGDEVELVGRFRAGSGDEIFVTSLRITHRADWTEGMRVRARDALSRTVQSYIPGAPGTLTLGLLIGDDSGLSLDDQRALQAAGISHITAVSGWNVTLVTGVVGAVFLALGLCGWRWTFVQLVALAGYVWIVGPDPPVIRAAIMGAIALTAARLGRPAHSVTALILSAALMVALSPASLTSLSFQLSVLATMGVFVALELSRSLVGWRRVVVAPVLMSVLTGLLTAPLLSVTFGTVTLLTIPANLLAAPFVTLATFGGMLTLLLSPVAVAAAPVGWSVWTVAGIILRIANVLASSPFGYWRDVYLSTELMLVLYAAGFVGVMVVLPEGRLMLRELGRWSSSEPRSATLAGFGCVAALSVAAFMS